MELIHVRNFSFYWNFSGGTVNYDVSGKNGNSREGWEQYSYPQVGKHGGKFVTVYLLSNLSKELRKCRRVIAECKNSLLIKSKYLYVVKKIEKLSVNIIQLTVCAVVYKLNLCFTQNTDAVLNFFLQTWTKLEFILLCAWCFHQRWQPMSQRLYRQIN